MKNTNFKSFLCGVLACLMVIGLCATVTAASATISVSYGTKVLYNGQAFQPKDAQGRDVQLITYNGTVYAPIRAICEKAGLKVDYDAATKTASIQTSDYVPPVKPTPQPDGSVSYGGVTVTGSVGFFDLPFWTEGDGRYFMEEMREAFGVTQMTAAYYADHPDYGPVYILSFPYEGGTYHWVLEAEYGEPIYDFAE